MILAKHLKELNKWYRGIQSNNDWTSIQIVQNIEKNLGLIFMPDPKTDDNVCMVGSPEIRDDYKETFVPKDILDYIYAVLHSPSYRSAYKEFSKIEFVMIPHFQSSLEERGQAQMRFWQLVRVGGELRQLHLLESPKVEEYITTYPVEGFNTVTRKMTKGSPGFEPIENFALSGVEGQVGKVWINDDQYFDSVPSVAWLFYIGGNQPAQKWLKDRYGRTLDVEDILHYQKIIVALTETHRLMQEIDRLDVGKGTN